MSKQRKINKRSQALLDFVLVFGILLALMVGLIRIWVWFDANFAKRNVDYQNTRLTAGQAASGGNLNYTDLSLTIDDDWVFSGNTSQGVGMPPSAMYTAIDALGGDGNNGASLVCTSARSSATALRTEADNMEGQAEKIRDFTDWAGSWALKWLFELMGIDVDGMEDAAEALENNAATIRTQANTIECAGCSSLSVAPYTC